MQRRSFIVGAFASAAFCTVRLAAGAPLSSATVVRQLRFTLVLSNPLKDAVTQQRIWVLLPLSSTGTQRLLQTRVSEPHKILADSIGQTILELDFSFFPAFGTKSVSIVVDVETRAVPAPVLLRDRDSWLAPTNFMEWESQEILQLASELRRETEWATAEAIYHWVAASIDYAGYVADPRGASDALRTRRGDCTEFAYLVGALARANGIPARVLGGYVVTGNAAPKAEEYHNWAELYLEGAWRLLDAQKRNWLVPAQDYVAFQLLEEPIDSPIGAGRRFKIDGSLRLRL